MEDSYIGTAIAGALYFVAGTRLARLYRRTGEFPELALSACFVCWSVSYLLYAVPIATANESLIAPFFLAANLLDVLGILSCAVFTWKVFRIGEKWAPLFVAGIALCLVIGIGTSIWTGEFGDASPLTSVWYWLEWAGATLTYAWIGVEASIQFQKAGQRQRLGLSDALVRNRLLLWGLVGAFWLILQFIFIVQDIAWARSHQWPAYSDTLVGILESASIGTVWVVFFPPIFYRRWVERSSSNEIAAER
jgi:hypothetical protein